eukprot:scaffold27831_cov75-Phaeocystis_antarctica.AAC.2
MKHKLHAAPASHEAQSCVPLAKGGLPDGLSPAGLSPCGFVPGAPDPSGFTPQGQVPSGPPFRTPSSFATGTAAAMAHRATNSSTTEADARITREKAREYRKAPALSGPRAPFRAVDASSYPSGPASAATLRLVERRTRVRRGEQRQWHERTDAHARTRAHTYTCRGAAMPQIRDEWVGPG